MQMIDLHSEAHARHLGLIVRITPNEVHCSDYRFIDETIPDEVGKGTKLCIKSLDVDLKPL
jgi:hypothetical protein